MVRMKRKSSPAQKARRIGVSVDSNASADSVKILVEARIKYMWEERLFQRKRERVVAASLACSSTRKRWLFSPLGAEMLSQKELLACLQRTCFYSRLHENPVLYSRIRWNNSRLLSTKLALSSSVRERASIRIYSLLSTKLALSSSVRERASIRIYSKLRYS